MRIPIESVLAEFVNDLGPIRGFVSLRARSILPHPPAPTGSERFFAFSGVRPLDFSPEKPEIFLKTHSDPLG
jgi:hypothetical protein